ncbi:complex I subunit 4 family protein [Halorussus amylolyticus]|uniref:complex I subunit 4 family protein n=1 Tax=Halorussus amylolyticus TaxID=1126242 RepID=UPI001042B1AB|nr:NuoM family protein [Halorussus amylolyticus]
MWIEALIAVTLASAAVVFLAPNKVAGKLAFVLSLLPVGGSLWMYSTYEASGNALLEGSTLAFETNYQWVVAGPYSLNWHVGLDGISMPLIALTTVLTSLALLASWTPIQERQSQFYGLMLFLEASLLGVFSALDFFVWFVFWEMVLVPMYVLIGVWGGPRRKYAAIKMFVYTNIASLALFIGFVALVFGLGDSVTTFDMPTVAQALRAGELGSLGPIGPETLKVAAFVAMFVGFAVKVPVVPFHTWLPDAHVEAPTPVSIMLAGVLLKMGTYALLRFNFTMLPDVAQANAQLIAIFAVVSVLYGAMLALAQTDLKRIVAYSSVSSMGYVILGLVAYTVYGMGGATFQMVAHGLISGLMFMAVGVIYNTTHTRMVSDMSGLASKMPFTVAVFVAGAFGYMGLPLMAGFAAELFIFLGSFGAFEGSVLFTAAAMFGIVIVAGYLLLAMQRTLFGPFELETDYEVGPAAFHDVAPLVVLILLVILLGVDPNIFFGMIQDAVNPIAAATGGGA